MALGIKKMIWMYRITPTVTGYSPFTIMKGRVPFTKDNQCWLKHSRLSEWSPDCVKENILSHQEKYKKYTDEKCRARKINLKVGDLVKVKLPFKVRKGQSKFSKPFKVITLGNNSVKLSDGKVWHLSRIVKCKEEGSEEVEPNEHRNFHWLDLNDDHNSGQQEIVNEDNSSGNKSTVNTRDEPMLVSESSRSIINIRSENVCGGYLRLPPCSTQVTNKFGRSLRPPRYLKDYTCN